MSPVGVRGTSPVSLSGMSPVIFSGTIQREPRGDDTAGGAQWEPHVLM
jgi:hypothetical protein